MPSFSVLAESEGFCFGLRPPLAAMLVLEGQRLPLQAPVFRLRAGLSIAKPFRP